MDISGFLAAIIADWVSLMSGAAGLLLTIIGFFRDQQQSKKLFWIVGAVCMLIASIRVWTNEHLRDQSQITYIELDTSQTFVPGLPLLVSGDYADFNFGRNNSGSYRADDVYGASGLEIHEAATSKPKDSNGQMWLTSPSVEKQVWEHFLEEHAAPYPKSVMTPGRVGITFTTAKSSHKFTPMEIMNINTGNSTLNLLAFVVWTDAAGTHERHRCQFFHFPPTLPFVLENCYGYNDFQMNASIKPTSR